MIIAALTISPLDKGIHLRSYIKLVIDVIKNTGVKYEIGAMATTLEVPTLDDLFMLVKTAEEALFNAGSQRVSITIKIDHRIDKDASIESKKKKQFHEIFFWESRYIIPTTNPPNNNPKGKL